jgi:ABC-2 type transport system permease protein
MWTITRKEISSFFTNIGGFIVIGLFLLVIGLLLFFFPDLSILSSNYASLDSLFLIAPAIFTFLIPAITMRTFSEEYQTGTIELLTTKPLTEFAIVSGKFIAGVTIVLLALLPTLIYFYSVYQLGSPKGNLDIGGTIGSYIGLVLLSATFVSIGLFASTLTNSQVVAFILGAFLCFVVQWFFYLFSKLPVFTGNLDYVIQKLGADFHYNRISKGLIDSRDVIYFASVIFLFLTLAQYSIQKRKI